MGYWIVVSIRALWGAKENGGWVGERENLTKRMEVESKEHMKLLANKHKGKPEDQWSCKRSPDILA